MPINPLLPILVPCLVFLFSEAGALWPRLFFVFTVLSFLAFLFTARQFSRTGPTRERATLYLILPTLFTFGALGFAVLLRNRGAVHLLYAAIAVFLYLYFRSLFMRTTSTVAALTYSLDNLSSYGTVIAVFFAGAGAYGLQSFLAMPVWPLMLVLLVVFGLSVTQIFWANGLALSAGLFWVPLTALILIELAWSLSFLSLSYYVLGAIIAIMYYMLVGLVRFYVLGRLTGGLARLYLGFGFLSIAAVLLTARWI
jgi:hypothetical protein